MVSENPEIDFGKSWFRDCCAQEYQHWLSILPRAGETPPVSVVKEGVTVAGSMDMFRKQDDSFSNRKHGGSVYKKTLA